MLRVRAGVVEAVDRQRELTGFVTDEWPSPLGRKVQLAHSATIWLSVAGLARTRVAPVAKE